MIVALWCARIIIRGRSTERTPFRDRWAILPRLLVYPAVKGELFGRNIQQNAMSALASVRAIAPGITIEVSQQPPAK